MGFGYEWLQKIRLLLWPSIPGDLLGCRIWSLPLMKFCLGAPMIWWVFWIGIYVQLQRLTTWTPIAKFHANNIFLILCHHFHPFSALLDLAGVCFSSTENPGSLGAFWSGETWCSLVDTHFLVHDAYLLLEEKFVTSCLESSIILFCSSAHCWGQWFLAGWLFFLLCVLDLYCIFQI